MFDPDPNIPTTPYRPQGYVAPVTAVQGKESTAAAITGAMCYNDFSYLLSSLLVKVNPTTPGGATNARRWTFSPGSTAPDTFASYTLQKGSSAGAEQMVGAVVNDLTMRWTERDAAITGNIMGQVLTESATLTGGPTDIAALPVDPKSVSIYIGSGFATNQIQTVTLSVAGGAATGGTFTLSFEGQTTTPLAFNAAASVVQTALRALPNLGSNVTVGGGPGPSAAFTLTFSGLFAGLDATLVTGNAAALTGPGAPYPNPAVVNTTPGSMTKLLRCLSCDLAIPARYVFPFTLNDADPSWSFVVQQGVDPRCTIVLEHDSVGSGYMTQLRARTTYYAAILARGPAIETIGGVPYPNALQLRFPFKFLENTRQDTSGVYTSTFPLGLLYDPTFGGWLTAIVDNSLAAL